MVAHRREQRQSSQNSFFVMVRPEHVCIGESFQSEGTRKEILRNNNETIRKEGKTGPSSLTIRTAMSALAHRCCESNSQKRRNWRTHRERFANRRPYAPKIQICDPRRPPSTMNGSALFFRSSYRPVCPSVNRCTAKISFNPDSARSTSSLSCARVKLPFSAVAWVSTSPPSSVITTFMSTSAAESSS